MKPKYPTDYLFLSLCFYLYCETLNQERVARDLNCTQSHVSISLDTLEDKMGPLFAERPPKHRRTLLPMGQALYNNLENLFGKNITSLRNILNTTYVLLATAESITFGSCQINDLYLDVFAALALDSRKLIYCENIGELFYKESQSQIDIIIHYFGLKYIFEENENLSDLYFLSEPGKYINNNFIYHSIIPCDWCLLIPQKELYNDLINTGINNISFSKLAEYEFLSLKWPDVSLRLLKKNIVHEKLKIAGYHLNFRSLIDAVCQGKGIALLPLSRYDPRETNFYVSRNMNDQLSLYKETIGFYLRKNSVYPVQIQLLIDTALSAYGNKKAFNVFDRILKDDKLFDLFI